MVTAFCLDGHLRTRQPAKCGEAAPRLAQAPVFLLRQTGKTLLGLKDKAGSSQ